MEKRLWKCSGGMALWVLWVGAGLAELVRHPKVGKICLPGWTGVHQVESVLDERVFVAGERAGGSLFLPHPEFIEDQLLLVSEELAHDSSDLFSPFLHGLVVLRQPRDSFGAALVPMTGAVVGVLGVWVCG